MTYIGTDIVDISRIKNMIQSKGSNFLNHIYSEVEIKYCSQRINPEIHYAGRFSAKEAIKKALLSSSLFDKVLLKDIIIDRDDSGIPLVKLPEQFSTKGIVNVSISHTDNYATATAIFQLI